MAQKINVTKIGGPSTNGASHKNQFRCCHCQQGFACRKEVKHHIASVHLRYFPYRCDHCKFPCVNFAETKEHHGGFHADLKPSFQSEASWNLEFQLDQSMEASVGTSLCQGVQTLTMPNMSTPSSVENSRKLDRFSSINTPNVEENLHFPSPVENAQAMRDHRIEIAHITKENSVDHFQEVKVEHVSESQSSTTLQHPRDIDTSNQNSKNTEQNYHVGTMIPMNRRENLKNYCKLCKKFYYYQKTEHVWNRHMPMKAFLCRMCDFGSALPGNMKRHIAKHHKGNKQTTSTWTDQRNLYLDELEKMMETCFGMQNEVVRRISIHCNLCQEPVYYCHRSEHVWTVHMDETPLVCALCDFRCAKGNQIRDHCAQMHDIESCWTNEEGKYSTEFKAVKKLCYEKVRTMKMA